jgi:hypothetical protein
VGCAHRRDGDRGGLCPPYLLLVLLLVAGCDSPDVVPVSGRVTLNGQPLAGACVTLQPTGLGPGERPEAAGSVGWTDDDGRFKLRLIEPERDGALVGVHIVTITTAESEAGDAAATKGERVPKHWRNGSQRFEVPAGGTREANFDLKPS